MILDTATAREILGVQYCRTCKEDAMILDSGYCPWCFRNPATGEPDFVAILKDREDRRKQRSAKNSKQYRQRVKAICLNCGEDCDGARRKFCCDACMRDWWRKKQNAERAAA